MDRWQDVADRWPERCAVVAQMLPAGRVLDLGAGAQGLRQHVPADAYTPADLYQRTPDTLPIAATIASTTSRRRPSEKFGTHSTISRIAPSRRATNGRAPLNPSSDEPAASRPETYK